MNNFREPCNTSLVVGCKLVPYCCCFSQIKRVLCTYRYLVSITYDVLPPLKVMDCSLVSVLYSWERIY
jgi:hypothetical protein